MAFESGLVLPAVRIPQQDFQPAGAGQGGPIRRIGHGTDCPGEKGDFGSGGGIVEPDTGGAGHREPRAIGRIGHRPVMRTDASFTQTGEGTFGQTPAGIVLGAAGMHTQGRDEQNGETEKTGATHPRTFACLTRTLACFTWYSRLQAFPRYRFSKSPTELALT